LFDIILFFFKKFDYYSVSNSQFWKYSEKEKRKNDRFHMKYYEILELKFFEMTFSIVGQEREEKKKMTNAMIF